jgi:hypothetical protein
MKTLQELVSFCESYAQNHQIEDLRGLDDWIDWGGYEINIFGCDWGIRIADNPHALSVDAYPANRQNDLPEAIHSFDIIKG